MKFVKEIWEALYLRETCLLLLLDVAMGHIVLLCELMVRRRRN
jgi:hypothetical protein